MNTRRMSLKLIAGAVGVASMLGLTSVASAAEHFNWYGGIRAGAVYSNSDEAGQDAAWDLGATGQDGTQSVYSRIGVRGSTELDDGTSVGFHVERNVGRNSLSQRHHNVWLGGDWGRLTLGQQGNAYGALAWDQTYFLGSNFNHPTSRREGIKYSSDLGGPVNFDIMATGNDTEGENSVDLWSGAVRFDAGPVAINVGHEAVQTDDTGYDYTAIRANGSFGGVDFYATYQTGSDNDSTARIIPMNMFNVGDTVNGNMTMAGDVIEGVTVPVAGTFTVAAPLTPAGEDTVTPVTLFTGGVQSQVLDVVTPGDPQVGTVVGGNDEDGANDVDSIGVYLGYGAGNSYFYLYHVNHKYDSPSYDYDAATNSETLALGDNPTETVLGYSLGLGNGATFIAEYLTLNNDLDNASGSKPTKLALAVKVDF